ncbi:MAG: tetratricopeptide repeat protein, partial [Myxococcales bacterium]|nr:tetratricopeptide repeat protein [Myxococcales bacterium]
MRAPGASAPGALPHRPWSSPARRALPLLLLLLLTPTACGDPPVPVPVTQSGPADAKATDAKATDAKAADANAPRRRPSAEPRDTFEAQLAAVDRRVTGQIKVTEKNARSSLAFGNLASLYLTRARLTGDYDDYAKAEEALQKAFTVGPKDYGPYMVRAQLNYTLHRLDRVDADFEHATRMPTRDGREQYRRNQFAGNLAFQRGQYEQALQKLQAALTLKPTLSALASLALYHWKAGRFDEAEALYQQALGAHNGKDTEPLAWVHLQLGLMDLDRGRYDEALAHYREGEALIRGYWLIEEHIAEILTLTGKLEEAKALYTSIIERTDNPEFMDAMAGIARDAGDEAEAARWIARARAKYEAQLERYPEAAYGHALEHFLEFGEDPARTVELAERNHALRPNADAKRLLAEAYLAAGRTEDARATIEQALATPMRSADLHATAAAVYAAAGDEA